MNTVNIFDGLSLTTTTEWQSIVSEMKSAFEHGELALLLGSGISQYDPSNVPFAGDITKKLKEQLFSSLPSDIRDRILESTKAIPFEVLMGRLKELNPEIAYDIVYELTKMTEPNVVHRQVASLFRQAAKKGLRFSVITTNYDLGISLAIDEELRESGARPRVIVREEDLRGSGDEENIELFYIHGALTHPGSLVLDFRDEFSLEKWKAQHLSERLRGTTLFILGFSGWDLDVSEAVAQSGVGSVIWLRSSRDSCDVSSWSWIARHLVGQVEVHAGSCIAVNSSRRLEVGLADLAPDIPVTTEAASEKVIEERYERIYSKYSAIEQPWYQLWARWVALRAGFSEIGSNMPENERRLLTKAQAFELRGRAELYAGRFRRAAKFQKKAADTSLQLNAQLDRYLDLRSHEADYWNRGAFMPNTLAAIITALLRAALRLLTGRSTFSNGVKNQLSNLIVGLFFVWPLPAIYVLMPERFYAIVRPVWRAAAQFLKGKDFDKYNRTSLALEPVGSTASKEYEDRYRWLGQEGRLINLYRVKALRYLRKYYADSDLPSLARAQEQAYLAVRWSRIIGDPYRLGKSLLVYLETMLSRPPWDAGGKDLSEYRRNLESLGLPWQPKAVAGSAWGMLRGSEIWAPYLQAACKVYTWGARGKGSWSMRIRFIGLALLETT